MLETRSRKSDTTAATRALSRAGLLICLHCGGQDVRVIDSRRALAGWSIKRRRECRDCKHRFNTLEIFVPEGRGHLETGELHSRWAQLGEADRSLVAALIERLSSGGQTNSTEGNADG